MGQRLENLVSGPLSGTRLGVLDLHMETLKKHEEARGCWTKIAPRHTPRPLDLKPAAWEVNTFAHPIFCEPCECPWESVLFNFVISSGRSNSSKGDFLSQFCSVLFCFPGGMWGGLGAE